MHCEEPLGPPVAAASRLSSRAATLVVSGRQLRGMSMTVVKPPAAAARVAVAKPSHSVRPGSLMWVWTSMRPGRRARLPRSSGGGCEWRGSGVRIFVDGGDDAVFDDDGGVEFAMGRDDAAGAESVYHDAD
jgi:hypothetical protein